MKIIFKRTDSLGNVGYYIDIPKPSKNFIPSWYKNMSNTVNKEKNNGLAKENYFATNSTLKGCSPFLDALMFGYIYVLPMDIEIKNIDNILYYRWRSNEKLITHHDLEQIPGLPPPVETNFDNTVLKWSFPFTIKTPKGYSCLFTHPLNRHDLPFRTFSGVVDTDTFPIPVQFPFQLSVVVEDTYIIEKGTPLCQIIPFKRENWSSKDIEQSDYDNNRHRFDYLSTIIKSYKKNYWKRKTYE